MIRVRCLFPFLLLLAAGACAAVPMATPQEDSLGKRFEAPPQDKGALYIYREGLMGALAPVNVTIGSGAGSDLNLALAPDTWVRLEGDPGPLEVRCSGDSAAGRRIEVAPGETRYVEVAYRIGLLSSGCGIAEVSPDRGQAAVSRGKRAVAGANRAPNNS